MLGYCFVWLDFMFLFVLLSKRADIAIYWVYIFILLDIIIITLSTLKNG